MEVLPQAARSQLRLAGSQRGLSWFGAGGGWQLPMIRAHLLLLSYQEKHPAWVTLPSHRASCETKSNPQAYFHCPSEAVLFAKCTD